jgi:hypothetical protein
MLPYLEDIVVFSVKGEKKKKHQNIFGRDFYQPGQENRRIRRRR